ncbi:unnamed protein product [Clonostachys chloroleuca]|uniref:Uncharacterized protein n=1 Tax=Clonostachys chloroleuca TaxID=1926264 RepID=A0AA35M9V5_9HYPO|nr:unnamed protein product [Clonostachys chloroleuca]
MPLTATLVAVNIYKSRWNPRSTHSFHPRHQKKIHYKSPIPPILRFQTFNFANMKFIATTILIAATTTVAQYDPCRSPLFAVPLCCKTDVLGVLGLNCEAPSAAPASAASFQDTCAEANARDAKCCLAHLLDQAVLCIPPSP